MKKVWFEKTVEYKFVFDHVCDLKDASPLDGSAEILGDLISTTDTNKYVLIEFKKHEKDIESEKQKFSDFAKAEEKIKAGTHHLLIFGKLVDGELQLEALTYFGHKSVDLVEWQSFGVSQTVFKTYLATLLGVKKTYRYRNQSSGGASSGSSRLVICKSEDGKSVCLLNFEDLAIYKIIDKDYLKNEMTLEIEEPSVQVDNLSKGSQPNMGAKQPKKRQGPEIT